MIASCSLAMQASGVVASCVVGGVVWNMFRTRKSRKNIIGLIETLRTQQKHNRDNKQDEREEKRVLGKKKNNQRTASVSPRGKRATSFLKGTIIQKC